MALKTSWAFPGKSCFLEHSSKRTQPRAPIHGFIVASTLHQLWPGIQEFRRRTMSGQPRSLSQTQSLLASNDPVSSTEGFVVWCLGAKDSSQGRMRGLLQRRQCASWHALHCPTSLHCCRLNTSPAASPSPRLCLLAIDGAVVGNRKGTGLALCECLLPNAQCFSLSLCFNNLCGTLFNA